MTMIVYADFACPNCYLASRRVDALRAAGVEVDWRAVEHRPATPIAGAHLNAARLDRFTTESAELSGMLLPGEKLPWTMPTRIPKTEAAV
jgi:predicted DsbA family dithiol-disulfide isomerase